MKTKRIDIPLNGLFTPGLLQEFVDNVASDVGSMFIDTDNLLKAHYEYITTIDYNYLTTSAKLNELEARASLIENYVGSGKIPNLLYHTAYSSSEVTNTLAGNTEQAQIYGQITIKPEYSTSCVLGVTDTTPITNREMITIYSSSTPAGTAITDYSNTAYYTIDKDIQKAWIYDATLPVQYELQIPYSLQTTANTIIAHCSPVFGTNISKIEYFNTENMWRTVSLPGNTNICRSFFNNIDFNNKIKIILNPTTVGTRTFVGISEVDIRNNIYPDSGYFDLTLESSVSFNTVTSVKTDVVIGTNSNVNLSDYVKIYYCDASWDVIGEFPLNLEQGYLFSLGGDTTTLRLRVYLYKYQTVSPAYQGITITVN